jgi:hypothetical protein
MLKQATTSVMFYKNVFVLVLSATAYARPEGLDTPPKVVPGVETRPYWGRYAANALRTAAFGGDLQHFKVYPSPF